MSVNDNVLDAITGYSVDLVRLETSFKKDVIKHLKTLESNLIAELDKSRLGEGSTAFQRKRMQVLLSQTKKTIKSAYADIAETNATNMLGTATLAESQAVSAVNSSINVQVLSVGMSEQTIKSIASNVLIQGAPSSEWWAKQSVSMNSNFKNLIRQSMLAGETTQEITRKVRGSRSLGYKDGIMFSSKRNAEALVRTSVQTVANESRLKTFESNDDIVKGIEWHATLDSRTTPICQFLDGKQWDNNRKPIGHKYKFTGPTAHWNCRSTQVPVLKSWEELGAKGKFKEIPESTRSSMDGQVSAKLGYEDWLKSKPKAFQVEVLGRGKWDLWQKGKVGFKDLVDQSGNAVSLDDLLKKTKVANKVVKPKAVKVVTHPLPKAKAIAAIGAEHRAVRATLAKQRADYENYAKNGLNDLDVNDVDFESKSLEFLDKRLDLAEKHNQTLKAADALRAKSQKEAIKAMTLPKELRSPAPIVGEIPKKLQAQAKKANDFLMSVVNKSVAPRVAVGLLRKNSRAYYRPSTETAYLASNDTASTIIHEVIHDLEHRYPQILEKTRAFLLKRAGGETPKTLRKLTGSKKYGSGEVAYEDSFEKKGGSHYMGKVYADATELPSMGIERLYKDASLFAEQDPEYFDFMIGILNGV